MIASSVAQRFEEALKTLETLQDRWNALATIEEQEKLASDSLTKTASRMADTGKVMASTCEATKTAVAEIRSVFETASRFLEGNDLAELKSEMQDMHQDVQKTLDHISGILAVQLQQAVQERDAALAEAASAEELHTATQQQLKVALYNLEEERRRHIELKDWVGRLPERLKRKYGLAGQVSV